MDKNNLAFTKANFILLAIGMVVVILGFILTSGGCSTETHFDPSIFSAMRVKVGPGITLIGFLSIIYAIMYKPKDERRD